MVISFLGKMPFIVCWAATPLRSPAILIISGEHDNYMSYLIDIESTFRAIWNWLMVVTVPSPLRRTPAKQLAGVL
ncbi:hypothetical protein [Pelosinus propionicus]|uniref:hypothetical protein n=1 Tax=Pelosinus propionicus TaxID=380084 RepID=UPI000B83A541|nr:hypothetical protein [Pelosinus propionicus]